MNQLKTIDLNLLPIETLGEMANEAAEQVEKNAKATVQKAIDAGRYLTAIKEQLEHGQWGGWLGANWNYSQKTATQYMQISNFTSGLNLTDASSISEALRMISDSKPETAPRSERKQADVVVSIPDVQPGQTVVQPDEPDAEDVDDDPSPDPPSIRKTAAGSEKVSEDKKPRTQHVVPEILPDEPETPEERHDSEIIEEWLKNTGFIDVVTEALEKKPEFEAKKAAKVLRKLADKLDPPPKFQKPDLEDVTEYFSEMNANNPESFFDFYESKGWLVGKVSMKNWQASARKWIRENAANGKGNGNGYRQSGNRNGSAERTAEDIFG